MAHVTLFPMNRTDKGNLVMQSLDTTQLDGTKLVFVDALRAAHFGIAQQVSTTWVECRAAGEMSYPDFCASKAIVVEDVELVGYIKEETGEPWITEITEDGKGGKPWFGLVST